ncbi:rutC family protein UK114-like [Anastrepha obliqua]|uniref:rutC family protein UK114-like n=1 Tax=Anastrepha obliqua TaxID=95512 RepID=UPI002409A586|nr:rutC family protein UK114-like [Anastrepha obliqua]
MSRIVRKLVSNKHATKLVAPYNLAVVADRTVYVTGYVAMDKDTLHLVSGGIAKQTEMALKNLIAVLSSTAAASGAEKVVKNIIYVKDRKDVGAINESYKKVFSKNFLACACIQASHLPLNALRASF